jgi:putative (di)nucleoside polyphosphate hydrolase
MYRLGVGLFLINRYKQVFVGKRINHPSNTNTLNYPWQMPQGGINEGEDEDIAIIREVEEEIGLTNNDYRIIHKSDSYFTYDIPNEMIGSVWGGKYIGQKQRWFLAVITSPDDKINVDTQDPEFEAWKWISKYSIPSVSVPFKREMYNNLNKYFAPHIDEYFIAKNS